MKAEIAANILTAVCLMAILWVGWRVEGIIARVGSMRPGAIGLFRAVLAKNGAQVEIETYQLANETLDEALARHALAIARRMDL